MLAMTNKNEEFDVIISYEDLELEELSYLSSEDKFTTEYSITYKDKSYSLTSVLSMNTDNDAFSYSVKDGEKKTLSCQPKLDVKPFEFEQGFFLLAGFRCDSSKG